MVLIKFLMMDIYMFNVASVSVDFCYQTGNFTSGKAVFGKKLLDLVEIHRGWTKRYSANDYQIPLSAF